MTPPLPTLDRFRRIVVKVGSSLVVDAAAGTPKRAWLEALGDDIAGLHRAGADVAVVSSGAVALGQRVLKLPPGALKLDDSQAAAAVGQIALARIWAEVLGARGITAGQVLVTPGDTEERRRYLNARATMERLFGLRAVPVINENDTVATSEIRYGDNDRLAARVATMASADLLVLLSDIDGLYTAPPAQDPSATLIPVVERIDASIEAMAGGAASIYSRGGMRTKVEAAKIATAGGTHMVIADGRVFQPLARIREGGRCTWFTTASNPRAARKVWIGGTLEPRGALIIDEGAARALGQGASLLPAGVVAVTGEFARGDCLRILDPHGSELGRGLSAFDSANALLLVGRNSRDIEGLTGATGRAAMIHRDDMALRGE
ncbi:glutamate 5-kinase [Lichenibacterium dinghuense]|uniref:glutamate 5-kinase n=1 Tax=Lichenibacterium dinghuense TaxID=2895977 RepID=UPI001F0080EB|nr:glutamate 5-kinase [Lichenibacterium sp. 6Y81]